MEILVIVADCILRNSSANLCHIAYLNGLVAAEHKVLLLSADNAAYQKDPSMSIPDTVQNMTYDGMTLYEKLSGKANQSQSANTTVANKEQASSGQHTNLKSAVIRKCKDIVLASYGPHGLYSKFIKTAQVFRSDKNYDYIISISSPPSSHLTAYKLIKSGHVKATHWIQIWEDPWYSDVYGYSARKKIKKEEQRLLSFADQVCYVSPLTLKNQQKLCPEAADKMYWQPLPYYYKGNQIEASKFSENHYGYFGDYMPASRDILPFYQAAVDTGISLNICGNPDNLVPSTEHIHVYPRLQLAELKPIEDDTNVLVFLCNRQGGQIPGKIYQYSATDKVILFILDGTKEEQQVLYEYFNKFHRYMFCRNTAADIARAIRLIEENSFGEVVNRPVEAFNPVSITKQILEGK